VKGERRGRTYWGRRIGVGLLMLPLLLWLGGCWLFNVAPVASFTVSAVVVTEGDSVSFSAILSEDEDGSIVDWDWDFGDGQSGTGEQVTHTYGAAGTYTVVLRVTDDRGENATTRKTIYVEAGEPAGPSASFTASPTSGTSPLSVQFDASGSSYGNGSIFSYSWDFGDGKTGYGEKVSHLFVSSGARSYTVTLTIRANDGKTDTATKEITITTTGGGTPSTGSDPSARFDIVGDSLGVAPFQAEFDPSDSKADDGRVLALFVWTFGDGSSTSDVNAANKTHVYTTDDPSEVFSVMLAVYDNENDSDSITKTVKAYNHQPVAGFEIANPPGGGGDEAYETLDVAPFHYPEGNVPAAAVWEAEDVTYGNLQQLGAGVQTVSVCIRSKLIPDARWRQLDGTEDQDNLDQADGTLATSSAKPEEPTGYDDHEFSYDPEGQVWTGGVRPAWFPNRGWGIQYLYVNWGDGTAEQRFDYEDAADTLMYHVYNFTGDADDFIITVRAEDYLGADASYSRTVFIKKGSEVTAEL